jgi:hypothetical protein
MKNKTLFILILFGLPLISMLIYWKMYRTSVEDEENGTCKSMVWTRFFGMIMIAVNAVIIGRNLLAINKLK